MIDLEALMRDQITRDLDCSESALELLKLRRDMKQLIADWKAAGGDDLLPLIGERVDLRLVAKSSGKPARVAARR